MKGRYIALVASNPSVTFPEAVLIRMANQPDFRIQHRSQDLIVWCEGGAPFISLGGNGLILGHLFRGCNPATRINHLSDRQCREIAGSRGGSLMAQYWGGYVAILCSGAEGGVEAIRDPSPGLPVFMRELGDCQVLATHVDDFEMLGLPRPTVDMGYVAAHLQNTGFRYRRTALTGITELPPGERVAFGGVVSSFDTVWSPAPFARSNAQIKSASAAEATLKDAVDGCVMAWAHCCHQALLGVSGGLDSSIVASVLKRSGIGLSLINFLAMEGTLGDERRFVDALARGLGHHVETTQEAIGLVDIFHCDGSHLPRPVARAFAQSGSHFITEVGCRAGIDAVFSGGGGDNVFCYLRSSAPLADRLLSGASPLAMLTTLRDVATVSGAGIGQIIRTAVRRMWRRQPRWLWKPNRQFLTRACEAMAFDIETHPWLASEMGLLPGKREHIGLITAVFNFLEGFGYERRWPVVYPLLSQPIIETCLRIPSWLWCANGSNRAVARSAYRDELPALTIARQSKGSFDRFAIEIIERHRRAIEDFICDGAMADAGIIDKDEVSEAIRAMTSYRDLAWSRVLTITDTEAWVRSRS